MIERDPEVSAREQGLFRKYDVRRVDGKRDPAGAEYFVLRDDDPHARAAVLAYANSAEATHPQLAADLRRQWG